MFRRGPLALAVLAAAACAGAWLAHGGRASLPAACPPPTGRGGPGLREHRITRPRWLADTFVTEYYPAPERWFSGAAVRAPGLPGRHRVDWLYSSSGLAMEGDGVGLDGRRYHFAGPYGLGWVSSVGRRTRPCPDGSWTGGRPAWLSFGWRTASGAVTYPLAGGGWSNGAPDSYRTPPAGLRFEPRPSRPLRYWRSVAVDPRLIPLGSRVFVPAYCDSPGGGWFVAEDTGGAIIARHVDVYRTAPASPAEARALRRQRIFVQPPGTEPVRAPTCA